MHLDCPQYLRDYLFYTQTIKGRSPKTVEAYYIDLRTFLRFVKMRFVLADAHLDIEKLTISDVTIEQIKEITISDIYEYLNYTLTDRSNSAKTRSRKVSSLRSFFLYLTSKSNLLETNPVLNLELPTVRKTLPKYLSLEESLELLTHVDSKDRERDYCIITLFLNCGMRLSELVGINLADIKADHSLKVTGKGNKERILYLNESCQKALETYLRVRPKIQGVDQKALFVSKRGRLSNRRVEQIVSECLEKSGLGGMGYSAHKLRHTAATLMYQHGGVDIRLLQSMLGHENLGTTEIYTHVSNKQLKEAVNLNPLSKVRPSKTSVSLSDTPLKQLEEECSVENAEGEKK